MKIPSEAECFRLMEAYRMLDNIRDHSILVARIAGRLVHDLRHQGFDLSPSLTVAAALLHDIAKSPCLVSGEDHAAQGRAICLAHGHPEIARIVGEHVRLQTCFPDTPLSEKELVYYADKRVNHDAIVSLEERMSYILKRYGQDDDDRCEAIARNFEQCRVIEMEIFRTLDYSPDDLAEAVARHPHAGAGRGAAR